MSIPNVFRVPEKAEWSIDTAVAINKALQELYDKALTIEYADTAPTEVPYGSLIIFDDGVTESIYFRTAEGNVKHCQAV